MRFEHRVTAVERELIGWVVPVGSRPERARMLLKADTLDKITSRWWDEAYALLAPVIGRHRVMAADTVADLARTHEAETRGLTTPLDVMRAMLRHIVDWADLDEVGRHAAIAQELHITWVRQLVTVDAAISSHGFPVAAADLHPPLTWGIGWTARILQAIAEMGFLTPTGETRKDGTDVYVGPDWYETRLANDPHGGGAAADDEPLKRS